MSHSPKLLLSLLEKQGQEFLSQFSDYSSLKSKIEDSPAATNNIEEDEWLGFSEVPSSHEIPTRSSGKEPEIVTFDHATSRIAPTQNKDSFMSSKISRLKENPYEVKCREDEESEEGTNIRNDALLHRLIHTQLLSGSLSNELMPTPNAQRRKALAGRVLELRGDAKLGQGETLVRKEEKNRANKSVREGILLKEKQRRSKALAEAKETGNYHSSLRKIYDVGKDPKRRRRDRGLSMGVGRFKAGTLKLSKQEIQNAQSAYRSRRSH